MWSLSFLPGTGMGPIVPGPSGDIGVSYRVRASWISIIDRPDVPITPDEGPMVARFVSQDHVVLGQRRRQRLEAMVRRGTAQVREVTRARIVLAAADRCSNAQIAAWVGVHVDTVRRVRRRFVVDGMSSLSDRPRPGRPLLYGPGMPGCWWWRPRRAFHRGR